MVASLFLSTTSHLPVDSKGEAIRAVNEIAELKSCNQILYLETRKHQDLYMYLGKAPQGPSIKFQVVNIHTVSLHTSPQLHLKLL